MEKPILTEEQRAVQALRDSIIRRQGPLAETPGGYDPREAKPGVVKLTEQPKP